MGIPLITVIIPFYNVQDYLDECLQSVLNQTYQNLEVVLVDDGSTDASSEISYKYIQKDRRVRYYLKDNGGLSDARNHGISYASGEYIVFVDGDDRIDKNQIEILYQKLLEYNADIAIGSYHQYSEQDGCFYIHFTEQDYVEQLYSRDEVINQLPNLERVDLSFITAWGKLYKKELFEHVQFPVGKLAEDAFIMYKLFLQCERIIFIKKNLYMYRKRKNSLTGAKMSESNLSFAPEARVERLAILAALGYDITDHASWYLEGLENSMKEAVENDLDQTETFRRIKENAYFLEHFTKT